MATKITLTQYLSIFTADYIRGVWGQRWISAMGSKLAALELWAKDGVKARMPTMAPSGGLQYLAKERGIERAVGETDAGFRTRLWGAWETWKWSGTDIGVYRGLETCGFTVSTWLTEPWFSWPTSWPEDGHVWIFHANDVLGAQPDGDADATHWARFWVVLDAYAEGYRPTTQTIGDGSLIGEGYAIGMMHVDDPTCAAQTARFGPVVRKWKGAHSTCPAIFMILSDGGWGDIIGPFGQLIGSGATIGGTVAEVPVGEL